MPGQYSKDFKEKVMIDVLSGTLSLTGIAKKNNISRITLYKWIEAGNWKDNRKSTKGRTKKKASKKTIGYLLKKKFENKPGNPIKMGEIKGGNGVRPEMGLEEEIEDFIDVKSDILAGYATEYIKNIVGLNGTIVTSLDVHIQDLIDFKKKEEKLYKGLNKITYDPLKDDSDDSVNWRHQNSKIAVNKADFTFEIGLFQTLQKTYKVVSESLKNNFEGIQLALGVSQDANDKGKVNLINMKKAEDANEWSLGIAKDMIAIENKKE